MKPIAFPLLVCLLLAACGTTPASPSPTSPPTSLPTLTATPPPSPTETAVPTPTEDPLAQYVNEYGPIPPDGTATGVDTSRKQYMREVNGEKQYWSPEINDWTAPHVVSSATFRGKVLNAVPLIAQEQEVYGYQNMIPMYIDYQVGVNGPKYSHHPADPSVYKTWQDKVQSFTGAFENELENYYWTNIMKSARSFTDDPKSLMAISGNSSVSPLEIKFTTPNGEVHVWKPSELVGRKVIWVAWDDADPEKNPLFIETGDWYTKNRHFFRSHTFVDSQKQLVTIISVQNPENLTDDQIREGVFGPVGNVLEYGKFDPKTTNYWGYKIARKLAVMAGKNFPNTGIFLVIQ